MSLSQKSKVSKKNTLTDNEKLVDCQLANYNAFTKSSSTKDNSLHECNLLSINTYLSNKGEFLISTTKALGVCFKAMGRNKLYLQNYYSCTTNNIDLTQVAINELVNIDDHIPNLGLSLDNNILKLPDDFSLIKSSEKIQMFSFELYLPKYIFSSNNITLGEYIDLFIGFIGLAIKTKKFSTSRFFEKGTRIIFAHKNEVIHD